MSPRNDKDLLLDILEAISRVFIYTKEMNYSEFMENTLVQDGVIRNLEIIGEAVKNLSENIKSKNTFVNWKQIAGMRDKLIHFYFGVNIDIVWSVIQEELPKLKISIEDILRYY